MVSNDMIYPQGSIMQLYRDLRPYQVRDEAQGPRGPMGGPRANAPQGNMPQGNVPQGNVPNVPQGNVPQANMPNMPQNGAMPTPPGMGRPGAPGQGFGRNRRGGFFGRNGLGRTRTDTFEVKDEQSGETYIFSIGAFPRFFYVTASKKKAE